jgi:hypothetical protein
VLHCCYCFELAACSCARAGSLAAGVLAAHALFIIITLFC